MEKTAISKTIARTVSGVFVGEIKGNVRYFRGIKYANALRWEYPRYIERYESEYDATKFGKCCYQLRAFEEDSVVNPFYYKEFRVGATYQYSEDCQYLNIWTPENANRLPVVVYIHGGSFTGGCAHENMICGEGLCSSSVIFVSLNYRLGPYGFASHPDLTNYEGFCGNYGLFDQLEALKWIKMNIEGFGGDPDNITLVGQSAGAMSVSDHCLSPTSEGLFQKAVLMSGAGALTGLVSPLYPEQTRKFWDTICKNALVRSMEELKKVDSKTLFYAWLKAKKEMKTSYLCTAPVIDGYLVHCKPSNALKYGFQKDIPYIVGLTKNDMLPIVFGSFAKKWLTQRKKASSSPSYGYYFTRDLPGDLCGAWHACDMLYMFETLNTSWRPFEQIDYDLSKKMSNMLSSFAKTGDPNCHSLPLWKSGTNPMIFDENCHMGKISKLSLLKNTIVNRGPM